MSTCNDNPIAFFITWVTYGTWLPGDQRGWVEYRNGWQLPDSYRQSLAETRMSESAVFLTSRQREYVQQQLERTCSHRGWKLYAANCRSNHVHVVVGAPPTVAPKKIRIELKAWATRRLNKMDCERRNWWAERGSIRWVFDEDDLEAVIVYTLDGQNKVG